jgi:hypothetical protein
VDVEVGDWLWFEETAMECRVTDLDHQIEAFTVLTPGGLLLQFYDTDLEPYEPPDGAERDELERWLRCRHKILPRLRVETTTTRCKSGCGCRACYSVATTSSRPGHAPQTMVQHFVDGTTCSCVTQVGGTRHITCFCVQPESP